ncbi:alpha/beta fold hydrolase [Paraburkholderia acidisoli]|uniref:Alpha/beta fold hydrolase n=2 Tax=Paraburkholderia acidisoli TaxID=2571748 RepID=A0A7Z2GMT8_9BURK|nr:alpha/beta hydrolase [Paraburkholderia acidisoli]QGZ64454.1 alpha/beta fold hydrolase [Paraburkholderia acidisoli]
MAEATAGNGHARTASPSHASRGERFTADSVTVKDGTRIYFKDWGSGKPVVLSHGWPLDADAWDTQMLFLVQHGYRVIAHDRRGHGRSGQSSGGNDVDTYADDLAAVIEALDLKQVTLVGHSMGGGEIARYMGRHGTSRVAKAVLISAVVPLMLKTDSNPDGLPMSAFDNIRSNLAGNRSVFYTNLALPFYGFNRPNAKVEQGTVEEFWREGMAGSILGQYQCVQQFTVDYTADLKKIDVPTLILHGDDDQLVPVKVAAEMSAKIIKNARLKIYPGAPHGMCTTAAEQVNADLLAFLQS